MALVNKKLIEKVDKLKADLKDATAELNGTLIETDLYKKFLAFALDENIPEKTAKMQALKVTLDFYKQNS
jgi:hypothetical protein